MDINKICVIHLNQIGDLAFSLPLLKNLRENFPDAHIDSVIKPYLTELLQSTRLTNGILPRTGGIRAALNLLQQIRAARYDLILCLSRSQACLMLTSLSRAPLKAGFPPMPWGFGFNITETIDRHNSWSNNRKLLQRLNIPITRDNYVGLIPPGRPPATLDLPQRYVVISPGASARRQLKTWSENKFAQLLNRLYRTYGLVPVLVGGRDTCDTNSTITNLTRSLQADNDMRIIDLSGKIGLPDLCGVLVQAQLFIGIDSGVMHLASVMDIPVVGLFGPTDPALVGPQNRRSVVVQQTDMPCVPCYLKGCEHRNCMHSIEADAVFAACAELIGPHA
ncbi:MAG: glycosyltransferase family 9 protein [Deltaproteobacteria bacterium]|nr:glycosyltransferase family 9 protein [Deltaproteobacteria bacterium]